MRASSDLHLTPSTAPLVWAALAELREDAVVHGGPTLLLGDLLDQPQLVDMPTWNRLRRELRAFPGEVWIIPGNHDQYAGWESALEGLDGANVIVVSEPQVTPFGLMIPHTDPAGWRELVAGFRTQLPPGLPTFAHQGFKGSYRNAGQRDTDGIDVPPDLGLIITGHYHMPQDLGLVRYCGSPYQTSFAEEGQVKSFLAWRSGNTPERVPYRFAAPRFLTVRWDGEGKLQPHPDAREGDRVRIITTMTRDDVQRRAPELRKAGLSGAAIVARPEVVASARQVVDPSAGPWDAAEQFVRGVHGERADTIIDFAGRNGLWRD